MEKINLREKLALFETHWDPNDHEDELGVWTTPSGARVAWFKDPDGNVLSLTQES
jgi:hypothetical protein